MTEPETAPKRVKRAPKAAEPKQNPIPNPPVVRVVWEDAYAPDVHATWVPSAPFVWVHCLVSSVGFLVYDGPEGIVLVESHREDFTGQRQQLPRGMIRSVTVLETPDASSTT